MPKRAFATLVVQRWTGWSKEQPPATSAQLTLKPGDILSPATLGVRGDCYSISVDEIGPAHILVTFSGFIQENDNENDDGATPLSGAFTGRCLIKVRDSMRLTTPSMDAGTGVSLTLDNVAEL